MAKNNSLFVVTKALSQTRFNLCVEMSAVDGEKITTEKICEMQKSLNKTKDWSTLELEIIPVQK